jgi:hypothetical protein
MDSSVKIHLSANKLSAVNRWCMHFIKGTQEQVGDVSGINWQKCRVLYSQLESLSH